MVFEVEDMNRSVPDQLLAMHFADRDRLDEGRRPTVLGFYRLLELVGGDFGQCVRFSFAMARTLQTFARSG